ncbi:alpha/beta hydrolase [Rhodopila sp.]|uniref:alpha/beta hydrolase n=1 Tax=Rhodopila sp. TaxID=2480087 RepID=UPI003D09B1BF
MPVDPQVQALLDEFRRQGVPPFDQMSVTQARLVAGGFRDLQGEPQDVGEVRDILVPGPMGRLPVRTYHPAPGKSLPLVVYFHGGGWVIGDIEIADRPCRALANASQCVVASVNYRLSPETKFPGPVDDCYAAMCWLAEHAADIGAEGRSVAVSGDSAGGNLAAVMALMARDRGGPVLSCQLLIYPVTAPAQGSTFASYQDNAEGYLLTRGTMMWFWEHYLASADDGRNPYAAPLHAADLRGLPPAMVITAEFDPLRDEGLAYAQRLREAGVVVKSSHYQGMIHGFFWMAGAVQRGRDLIAELANELREQFAA